MILLRQGKHRPWLRTSGVAQGNGCAILIVDEPTRGVDVGAKAEIHRLLDQLACHVLALLVISSELPEIMNLSRRIIVMRDGDVAGELERADFSQPALMRLMAGMEAKAA